ncbi:MAG TPA: hypothetical protein VK681_27490 [Reyranella sp.]|nr:hypothetical protein [Reyranella sp.]
MATITERGTGGIDTRDFKAVAKALKKAQPLVRTQLLRNFKLVGGLVAKDAQAIVAEHSESIPPTVKARVRGVGVSVVAGGGEVAIAGLFELGNTGNRKSASASSKGVFRHPVHGNLQNWVNQPMHPFLAPAGEKNRAKTDAAVLEALDAVTEVIVLGE